MSRGAGLNGMMLGTKPEAAGDALAASCGGEGDALGMHVTSGAAAHVWRGPPPGPLPLAKGHGARCRGLFQQDDAAV